MTNKQAYAGLREQLLRTVIDRMCPGDPEGLAVLVNPDGPEAADAISSLLNLLEKAAPFVGWASTRQQIIAGVDAAELCDEIDAALNSDAPLSIGEGAISALQPTLPVPQGEVERVILEAIGSTSAGNGNAVQEAVAKLAALTTSPDTREALAKYGQHLGGCRMRVAMGLSCVCGWDEARAALVRSKLPVEPVMLTNEGKVYGWETPIGDDVREEWSLCFYGSPPAVIVKAGIPGLPDSRRDIAYMEFVTNEEWETTGKLLQKLVSEHNAAITAIGSQSIEGERLKPSEIARDRADWLLDAVATATQDRRYLRGDPEYDEVAGEAILLNGEKAICTAITAVGSQSIEGEREIVREKCPYVLPEAMRGMQCPNCDCAEGKSGTLPLAKDEERHA